MIANNFRYPSGLRLRPLSLMNSLMGRSILKKAYQVQKLLFSPRDCLLCSVPLMNLHTHHFHLCVSCYTSIRGFPRSYCVFCGQAFSLGSLHNCRLETIKNSVKEFLVFSDYQRISLLLQDYKLYRQKHLKHLMIALFWCLCKRLRHQDLKSNNSKSVNKSSMYKAPKYVFTSIPSHPKNVRKRGWDHMQEIVRGLSRKTCWPFINYLSYEGTDVEQKGLGLRERQKRVHVKRSTEFLTEQQKQQHVLLLDDVITTGTSIQQGVKHLQTLGFSKISVLTLGRVLLDLSSNN